MRVATGDLGTAVRKLGRRVARSVFPGPGIQRPSAPGAPLPAIDPERPSPAGGPRFRSRFGGLWTDLSNAGDLVRGKLALGRITAEDAEHLHFWIENGYVVLERAVPDEVVERVKRDVEVAWEGADRSIHVEYWQDGIMHVEPVSPALKSRQGKLLDMHAFSPSAREAIFAPAIRRFLNLVFERPALAFQSLYFERGTQQPIHQDTAYVVVSSPLELAASWIALEDVGPGTGELEYYVGSHRLPEFLFAGRFKAMPPEISANDAEHLRYLQQLHDEAARLGLERAKFRPRKGDALLWSADLAHGGSQQMDPASSRRSLVTHYCPIELDPGYFRHAFHSDKIPCGPGCAYTAPLR